MSTLLSGKCGGPTRTSVVTLRPSLRRRRHARERKSRRPNRLTRPPTDKHRIILLRPLVASRPRPTAVPRPLTDCLHPAYQVADHAPPPLGLGPSADSASSTTRPLPTRHRAHIGPRFRRYGPDLRRSTSLPSASTSPACWHSTLVHPQRSLFPLQIATPVQRRCRLTLSRPTPASPSVTLGMSPRLNRLLLTAGKSQLIGSWGGGG